MARNEHLSSLSLALLLTEETAARLRESLEQFGRLNAAMADAVGVEPGPDPGQRAYEKLGMLGDTLADGVRLCAQIEQHLLDYRKGV